MAPESKLSEQDIVNVCMEISKAFEHKPTRNTLINPVCKQNLLKNMEIKNAFDDIFLVKLNDVRLAQNAHGSRGSVVDRKKLIAAEKKLAQKRAERKSKIAYSPDINWDLVKRNDMIVSQSNHNAPNSSDLNIKITNFEIKYATSTILENANINLSYGRRYGLVGMNGVGKSTLLLALSSGHIQIPSGIRIQHIEQDVSICKMIHVIVGILTKPLY